MTLIIITIAFFCRKALEDYGIWDQIRVDYGREFYLTLFMQEMLCRQYGSPDVCSYVQSTSTEVGYSLIHYSV